MANNPVQKPIGAGALCAGQQSAEKGDGADLAGKAPVVRSDSGRL